MAASTTDGSGPSSGAGRSAMLRRAGRARPDSSIPASRDAGIAVIRATGRPRSVIVTACPAATPATTAEAFCFRARIPTSDMFYNVVHSIHGEADPPAQSRQIRSKGVCPLAVKIISWNMRHSIAPWQELIGMDADVALLQEACKPPRDVDRRIATDFGSWRTPGEDFKMPWRAAVVGLSDRVAVEWIEMSSLEHAASREFALSRPGTLAAGYVTAPGIERFVVVSMYSIWMKPHTSTGSGWIVSDASAHRLVSDLSILIGQQQGHRIVAAGDLNILHGHGEYGSKYWAARYETVFTRMEALGLPFVGPQAPHGRQADPWPDELPSDSRNVPTYHPPMRSPATATRQLDYVFASRGMADSVSVRALNEPDEWGPSDHCRLEIMVS